MAKFWLLFWLLLLLLSLSGAISKQEEEEVKLRLLAARPPLRLSILICPLPFPWFCLPLRRSTAGRPPPATFGDSTVPSTAADVLQVRM